MLRTTPILLLCLAVATACSEYELESTGADEPAAEDVWQGSDDSPWDEIDEGALPAEYFAVAWRTVIDVCPECEEPRWQAGDLRYDLVDVRGTVVRSFDWPGATADLDHLTMIPAGPGRFLVTARSDASERRTWLVDDQDASVTEVLRVSPGGLMTLPVAGRQLSLGAAASRVRISADPLSLTRLYVISDDASDGESRIGPVRSVDWSDPFALVHTWPPDALVPADLHDGEQGLPGFPWTFQASFDGDQTRFVVGLDGMLGSKVEARSLLLSWAPADPAEHWSLDVTDLAVRTEPSWIPDGDGSPEGTALFQVGGQSLACAPPEFSVRRSDAHLGVVGDEVDCAWSGPLLDPVAPTFVYHGFDQAAQASDMGHALYVSHAGEEVWTIDRFALGLTDYRFLLREAIRIQAP